MQIPLHRPRARLNPRLHFNHIFGFPFEVAHIRHLIRRYEIDLVQVFGILNIQGAFAARLENVPLLVQLNSTVAPMPLRRFFSPIINRMADVVMSEGKGVAQAYSGTDKLGDRLLVFFPPVDTEEFYSNTRRRLAAREELGVPDDVILIGTVGNFNRMKGHEFFVRSAAILRREHSNVCFRILGTHTPSSADYYKKTVKVEASKLGLIENDILRFIEPGDRVVDLLPGFDIFLLTSRVEGVGTVTIEAMSCGLPVVATNVGSVSDVVEDGITGYVVPPLDHEQIANATHKLLCNPKLRVRMGEVARSRAINKYDIKFCVETHLMAYKTAIAHRKYKKSS